VLHGDILDPWCWVAEKRVVLAADGFHGRFLPLETAPLPRRWEALAPTAAERRAWATELRRASREPDAPPFSTELWNGSGGGPLSSAPALIAVAAARLQGEAAAATLRGALREAALVAGLDVSRPDVIVELAARAGVDLARFVPAFEAPATEDALLDDIRASHDLGVTEGPALVINDDWLVTGMRSLRDYRVLFKRYLAMRAGTPVAHTVH
jgi:predicted DsbA family dithiol-disulfide isomerase